MRGTGRGLSRAEPSSSSVTRITERMRLGQLNSKAGERPWGAREIGEEEVVERM